MGKYLFIRVATSKICPAIQLIVNTRNTDLVISRPIQIISAVTGLDMVELEDSPLATVMETHFRLVVAVGCLFPTLVLAFGDVSRALFADAMSEGNLFQHFSGFD